MIRNVTFSHHVGFPKYCAGSEMMKIIPVSRFSVKPTSAHGMNSFTTLIGTRFMKPSSRRSNMPATPSSSASPAK